VKILEGANLGLRFLLELGAVAASAYWGWKTGDGVIRWVLTIAAPLGVIVVWALFVSPNPTIELARPLRFAIEVAVWAAVGAALAATGRTTLGITFFVVAVVSGALNWVWD
jgi:hypothetical protein